MCSSFASASRCISSLSFSSRSSVAGFGISGLLGPEDEARLDRQLVHGEPHGLARSRLVHTRQLEHDPTRLHDRDPMLGIPLAGTHAGLGRLLGHGLVGEDRDPDLAASLDMTRHRDSGGLDLTVRDPARLERLDAVVTKRHFRTALGDAAHATSLGLAVSHLLRHQHQTTSTSVLVAVELGGFVRLTGTTLDLLFLREEPLELGSRFLDQLGGLGRGGVTHRRRVDGGGLRCSSAAAAAGPHDPARLVAGGLADGHRGLFGDLVLGGCFVREYVTLVDPDLHADPAGGGLGFRLAVVDVGSQCVQRHPAFPVPLPAAHLGATETPAALHTDALRAGLHGRLHGTLHRAPEAHAAGELVGNALRDEACLELGLLDLLDVEVDLGVTGDLQQTGAQAIGLRTTAADHDAGSRGVDIDAKPVTGAFDLDPAHCGPLELALQIVADLPVLDELVGVLAVLGEPARLPIGRHAQPEPVRVHLLSHEFSTSSLGRRRARACPGPRAPLAYRCLAYRCLAYRCLAYLCLAYWCLAYVS